MSMSAGSTKAATKPVGMLTDAIIQRIDTAQGEIVLKHGDIPNLGMPAMTMAFEADAETLKRAKAGEKVRFHAEIMKGKPTSTQSKLRLNDPGVRAKSRTFFSGLKSGFGS